MKYFDDKGLETVCECLMCGAVVPDFDAWWLENCSMSEDGHTISWEPYPWLAKGDDAAPGSQ
jgi:hypothetical protein